MTRKATNDESKHNRLKLLQKIRNHVEQTPSPTSTPTPPPSSVYKRSPSHYEIGLPTPFSYSTTTISKNPNFLKTPHKPNNKSQSFLKFTKKARQITGDLVFGSVGVYDDENMSYKDKKNMEYQAKMLSFKKQVTEHTMEFYLEYLRFFLDYMDNSEFNDILNYSITRNDLWLDWYKGFLKSLDESIKNFEDNEDEDEDVLSLSSSSSVSSYSHLLKPFPTMESIDKEIFQDRRIILCLLWYIQIFNKIINQPFLIRSLLANCEKNSEICVITANKMKSFHIAANENLKIIFNDHLSPSNLEFIDGWQIHHDFPEFSTNFITISDRFQMLIDFKHSGYLSKDLIKRNPNFNSFKLLSDDFLNFNFDKNEKKFINSYSSFTTPRITDIPLNFNTQSLIYSPDFTKLIKNRADLMNCVREFKRILKTGGKICINLWDYKIKNNDGELEREVEITLLEYVKILINLKLSQFLPFSNIAEEIVPILKNEGFQKIKFSKIGYPLLNDDGNGSGNDKLYSFYSMFGNFLEFVKFSGNLNLHDWITDPKHINVEHIEVVKLFIDYKLNGVKGENVKHLIQESNIVKNNGIDKELGFKVIGLGTETGFGIGMGIYNEESVGLDYITILTAEKA